MIETQIKNSKCTNISKYKKRDKKETVSEYTERIKKDSKHIFYDNYEYKGKKIVFDTTLNKYGMPVSFDHATTNRNKKVKNGKFKIDLPDMERLSKIHWLEEVFGGCLNCKDLIELPDPNNKDRISIICKERLYFIVLEEDKKQHVYNFITAYPIDEEQYYKYLKRKKSPN